VACPTAADGSDEAAAADLAEVDLAEVDSGAVVAACRRLVCPAGHLVYFLRPVLPGLAGRLADSALAAVGDLVDGPEEAAERPTPLSRSTRQCLESFAP
jgi:hypothetical protein